MQKKNLVIYAGFIWCMAFAALTFYWASGGMLGVRSLGGVIYEKALSGDENFLSIVRLTGVVKMFGGFFLLLLLRDWPESMRKVLYYLSLAGGVCLFLYGLANFTTLILDCFAVLNLELEEYSLKWRMLFWEPFWMLGGILFILSAKGFRGK
ncbi:DUF3995 domain-containing protein [Pseudobacillus badius]|uniref:DUF3995 domain-containing protein n=1 Tax=Bacillus badius TaxID=1455 RepID=UPI0007B0A3AA|nr:DUF3995 domain-containing protein [Bacillus badius]KZO01797.1 hypothetical protein A4244_01605 [Bacillus badius]OCS90190.1 hypothetical protein A6M11_01605 [Bacillus badius]OVE53719.1 DUF3995 domain-containing protein [Bacillus badius]TDW06101.1 uncharacterized protein DUF3995 [Bacillus badius]